MTQMELIKERPLFLDDYSHKMKVVKYYGRPEDEIKIEVEGRTSVSSLNPTESELLNSKTGCLL